MPKYQSIPDVYNNLCASIRYWEQKTAKSDNSTRRETGETIATELTGAAADLENAKEINPPKLFESAEGGGKVYNLFIDDAISFENADAIISKIAKARVDAMLKSKYKTTGELNS